MAMKPKRMRNGGGVKKMAGGGRAGAMKKPEPFKKGGVSVSELRKMAKDKGYKLVKD
jgi:hypothetical protein